MQNLGLFYESDSPVWFSCAHFYANEMYDFKVLQYESFYFILTLSGLSLPLSSSTTTSRELLPQFSTCSGWRWFDVGEKFKKIAMYC